MAKMRGFKPELWTDEKFVELPPLARLLFMGMWTYACDNGHLDDKPRQIKMRVLPTDEVDAGELIDDMVDLGMVDRNDDGLVIRKLRDHQRLDNRYFTWCDRCQVDEIPEPARTKYLSLKAGIRRAPDVSTVGARSGHGVVTREGRKEGDEGEGERKAGATTTTRKRVQHQLPTDFTPNDANRKIAEEKGLNLDLVVAQFSDHHRAKGTTMKDWHLALNTWLRRERPTERPGRTRDLPHASQLEAPPDGLSESEYAAWERESRARRQA